MTVTVLLQINDLYHIDTSVDYSRKNSRILPRIATVLKRLKRHYGENQVKLFLPGDFLGPSCLSREFKGEHMVDVMNAIGVDYVTAGNHEFDFSDKEIIAAVRKSSFKWILSNFSFRDDIDLALSTESCVTPVEMLHLSPQLSAIVVGLMYESSFPEDADEPDRICTVLDPVEALSDAVTAFRSGLRDAGHVEHQTVCIALTHQTQAEDRRLAATSPSLRLIMGGHDHDVAESDFEQKTLIVKTLSNARSLRINWLITIPAAEFPDMTGLDAAARKELMLQKVMPIHAETLRAMFLGPKETTDGTPIDDRFAKRREKNFQATMRHSYLSSTTNPVLFRDEWLFIMSIGVNTMQQAFIDLVPQDRSVARRISKWLNRSKESHDIICNAPYLLEGEDRIIRKFSTSLGNLIADIIRGDELLCMDNNRTLCKVAIINSGSFRIDRNIEPGEPVSQKTVCDIFFHKNGLRVYQLPGGVILRLLQRSLELRNKDPQEGDGEFLQLSGAHALASKGKVASVELKSGFGVSSPLLETEVYSVATTAYVATRPYKQYFEPYEGTALDLGLDIREVAESALATLGKFGDDVAAVATVNIQAPRWLGDDFERESAHQDL